jgi:hypothetical protein
VFHEETKMIGCFLLGAAGLMLLSRIAHRHHHGFHGHWARCGAGWGGPGGGCGPRGWMREDGPWAMHDPGMEPGPGWGGGDGGWMRHNPFRSGFVARALSDRLDATPAQEKVIRDATDEFRESAAKLKGEGKRTRAEVAAAFRKGHFDEVLLGELYARHDRSLEDLRKAFVGMGARIHDALDDRQRARLADLIEAGPGFWSRQPGWRR